LIDKNCLIDNSESFTVSIKKNPTPEIRD